MPSTPDTSRVLTTVGVALSIVCLPACGSESAPRHGDQPLQFETDHFRYYADPDRKRCDRTPELLELVYTTFADYLEIPYERADKIEYYYDGSGKDVYKFC